MKAAGGGVTPNGDGGVHEVKENGVNGVNGGDVDADGVENDVLVAIVKAMPRAWVVKPKFELPGTSSFPLPLPHPGYTEPRRDFN